MRALSYVLGAALSVVRLIRYGQRLNDAGESGRWYR